MKVLIPFHNMTLQVEAEGELETLKEAQRWLDVPKRCPVCGLPTELRYRTVTAKKGEREGEDFEYVDVQCTGRPKRHSSTLGQYKPKNGGGFYYRENLDKFPWDEYDLETRGSRPMDPDERGVADPEMPNLEIPNLEMSSPEIPSSAATEEPAPTRADLLQVYAALQDKDKERSSAFLSFLAAYQGVRYTPETAREVLRDLQILSGPDLLGPLTLKRILEKTGAWAGGAFALEPDALRTWETRFVELSRSAA